MLHASRMWTPVFAVIDMKKCTLSVKDGTSGSGQNSLEVVIGEGNLTYSETRNIVYVPNRGVLDKDAEVKEGDQVPVDVSFSFNWTYLTSNTTSGGVPTLEEALKKEGPATDWVSSDDDECRPYAVDLELVYKPTPAGCGDIETYLFSDFRYEKLDHDLKAGTITCTGKCNIVRVAIDRSANTTGT